MLTAERLRAVIHYDPKTGAFTRNGKPAGCINSLGYRVIRVDGILYQASRLAALYVTGEWPDQVMDHINRIRDDDRWDNLRSCTHVQNMGNTPPKRGTISRFKGVAWDSQRKKWLAQIRDRGRNTYLGRFDNEEDAAKAYNTAAVRVFGEFAFLNALA